FRAGRVLPDGRSERLLTGGARAALSPFPPDPPLCAECTVWGDSPQRRSAQSVQIGENFPRIAKRNVQTVQSSHSAHSGHSRHSGDSRHPGRSGHGCGSGLRPAGPENAEGAGRWPAPSPAAAQLEKTQLRLSLTSLVISNIETVLLPPKTSRSASSALMFRLSFLSCRPFFFT